MAQQPHFALTTITPPAKEPVTVDYVKRWLRIDSDEHATQLQDLITTGRQLCEDYSGRAFITATFQQTLDRFPMMPNTQFSPGSPSVVMPILQNTWPLDTSAWAIKLPRAPVQSVTSIQYYDVNGQLQTLASSAYLVDNASEPGRIAPVNGGYWPGVQWRPNAVTVQFKAGYGDTADKVPTKFRMAIAACVGWLYDYPNGDVEALPLAVKRILDGDPVAEIW